ncbi:MAG: hypothetical protein EXS12_08950 [Phycisphaerales bacterium]|nr:hypothetical protein [Phycisphaerales bacterium]
MSFIRSTLSDKGIPFHPCVRPYKLCILLAHGICAAGRFKYFLKPHHNFNARNFITMTTQQHSHWGMVTLNGALLVLGGLALVAVPFLAAFTFAAAFGLCLVAIGAVGLFAALKSMSNVQHSLLVFLGPFLSIMIGAVLWFTPAQGLMALTEVLGAFTVVTGIFQVVAALGLSGKIHWGLLLLNGLLTLGAGAVMLFSPGIAVFVFAIFFGVQLVFSGFHLVRAGFRMKHLLG